MGGRSGIDWEAIRIEYSTSPLSVEAIATKHGASKRQMLRRIKEGGWKRDLSNVIRVETEATLAELAAARKAEQTRAAEVATQAAIERATGKKAAMNLAEKADVTSTPNVTDVTSTKVPDGTTHVTKALLVPTEAYRRMLEEDLRSQEDWHGVVLVVPPVIDLEPNPNRPPWSLGAFDRMLVQTLAGRICQLPMDAYKNPHGIKKAALSDPASLSECECSTSVMHVDGADESLLFVDAEDTAELIQMITRLQPGVVFRTPHAVELLGAAYPGFFEHLSEAAELAKSADVLVSCDRYLKTMDRTRFSLQQFAKNVQKALQSIR
jgi:hypothetical protein